MMNSKDYFTIESSEPFASTSRNTRGETCTIRFRPLEENARPDLAMSDVVSQLMDRVLAGRPEPLLVGLQVQPPNFHHPFTLPLRPLAQNNPAALAAAIERLNEISQAGIDLLSGTTTTKVVAVWPLGSQRTSNPADHSGGCDTDQEHVVTARCRSIFRIINPNDRLCLARAVFVGITKIWMMEKGEAAERFKAFCKQPQDQHAGPAIEMLRKAGIPLDLQEYSLHHVEILQRSLNHHMGGAGYIRLVVFKKEQQYRIVYKGEGKAARFNICILLENNHYHYIDRPEQLFNVDRYCIDCEKGVSRWSHWAGCSVVCRLCMRTGPEFPCQLEERIPCAACGFVFPKRACYDYHLRNEAPEEMVRRGKRTFKSICKMRRICARCNHIIYADQEQRHQAECQPRIQQQQVTNTSQHKFCNQCKGPHKQEQPCYIQPLKEVGDEEDNGKRTPLRLCFFDAETSQDEPMQVSNNIKGFKHVPLLIIAEVICEKCIIAGFGVENIGQRAEGCFCGKPCNNQWRRWCSPPFRNSQGDNTPTPENIFYNPRRMYFHSFDNEQQSPVDQFLDYLQQHGPKNVLTVCIAHNGGKYDFHLLLEALYHRSIPPKRLCTTGLKIYSMRLGGSHQRKVLFKDSLNYFFCELDALTKVFALPEELATTKPFFPYLYVKRQHLHERIRGVPPLDYYQPDYMKVEKREKLIEWHQQQMNNTTTHFQLREQLIVYCVNDVAILRESVLRFRHLIGEQTQKLDPFIASSTAAGLALTTLRRCFLPENWLVHSPEGGYLRGRRASAESQRYIKLFEMENPESSGKVQCAQWAVGEAHVEDSGYRLDGLWHRSPPLRPLAIEYMGTTLYERTQQRLWELENQHGYALHVVWGHEMKERLIRNPGLKRQWWEIEYVRPMDPREDCLRGGRTEPFKLHHVCGNDEEILYIDIVSLYPYVMKTREFPIGHPTVLTRETLLNKLPWTHRNDNIYKGLLLVKVLPPTSIRGPLPPLLGYRTHDGRLTFPLCSACANARQQHPCHHPEKKRSWVSGYTHVELNKALELGYKVVDVYEVWHYERWGPDLFKGYVNTFVGLKQQASGWPQGCETLEQKQRYLDEFEQAEGIRLDMAKVELNPGLRMIAKILANSLWGKLAQRVGGTEIRYARTPAEFHQLLEDPTIETLDFSHVSEEMDICVLRRKAEFAKAPETNCLPVAVFVTSYARLHLYSYMQQVNDIGGQLLYCDTDSIIYVTKRGERVIEGEALGQMKREIPTRRIVEFIAGGPKNYGYRHVDAETGGDERAELKIRSFPHQLLNFHTMKQLVLDQFNIDGEIDEVLADGVIAVDFPQIGRTRFSELYTHMAHKDYRPCYKKGRIMPRMETLPFGYREEPGEVQEDYEELPGGSEWNRDDYMARYS
uniref:DNA-directed DNA polymerase n=1 Tax=Meloidogyne incognita TaxID=6306 RepID=A0A914MGR2_MELIC